MPQTSEDRFNRWWGNVHPNAAERYACEFLEMRGYELTIPNYMWRMPPGRLFMTSHEHDAVMYLIEEWDFNGCFYAPQDQIHLLEYKPQ